MPLDVVSLNNILMLRRKDTSTPKDITQFVVCKETDIKENEMKAFEFDKFGKILLVKQSGKLYAIGNKCTHYGALLHTGYLGNGRVRCPWHGACFNIETGDIEDFPGMDSLPRFEVKVDSNGDVNVKASCQLVSSSKRIKEMAEFDSKDKTTFVVVGGGPSAAVCAETLRQEGFTGRVVMVTKEGLLPYDRVKLSKALDITIDKIQLRPTDFYKKNNIEVMLSTEVVGFDVKTKTFDLSSGRSIKFDSAYIATGSTPRLLTVPGCELKNVLVLRDLLSANEISKRIGSDKDVVIYGLSFIGLEVAAYCQGKVKSVTVVGRGSVPLKLMLGEEIGTRIKGLFIEKGVSIVGGVTIEELVPTKPGGNVLGFVKLSDNQLLRADFLVVGIGAMPNTRFLAMSGMSMTKEGAVCVNKFLQTTVHGVYAGGDIAHAPVFDKTATIGHWQLASYHGRVAALNMMGRNMRLQTVPFFWTMFLGKSIRYAGYAPTYDKLIVVGNVEEMNFAAYFCSGSDVAAIATCGRDPLAAKYAELRVSGRQLSIAELQTNPETWS